MSRLALPRPSGAHRLAANLTKLLALLLAVWVLASAAAEVAMLHPRHWRIGPTPAAQGFAYRDVAFRSDGLTLRGWWVPGTLHRTVVMIHGWTSSRAEPMSKAGYLMAAGYNVLVFDLRGHGASDGNYTTMGYREVDDVHAAIALAQGLDAGAPIALLGYSMGAALAVEEAARNPAVVAVIEDSGFSSLSAVFAADFAHLTGGLPAMPLGLAYVAIAQRDLGFDINSVKPVADAAHLSKPLLAILGTADRMVPPAEGYAIYAAAQGPKQLFVVPGAGHTQEYFVEPGLYKSTVLGFLAANLSGPKATVSLGR
jgi:pimeloyl-ACP methyl ester carboxylesterase